MPRTVSPFKLGLFIIICGSLAIALLIWLGASRFLETTATYVSYFNESIKGLQKDAPVNYRGVAVGRVSNVGLAVDGRLIEVTMELKPEFKVDPGVSIQLRDQGLTGIRYLEIDTAPKDIQELTPKLSFTPQHPVIPSYPSDLEQLKQALQNIYDKVYSLDIQKLTDTWTRTAELINGFVIRVEAAVDPAEWNKTVLAFRQTAEEASSILGKVSRSTNEKGMQKGFNDLAKTLDASRRASESLAVQLSGLAPGSLSRFEKQLGETSTSLQSVFSNVDRQLGESNIVFQQSLQQFKQLLVQLNSLVQTLKEHPNRVLIPASDPDPFKKGK